MINPSLNRSNDTLRIEYPAQGSRHSKVYSVRNEAEAVNRLKEHLARVVYGFVKQRKYTLVRLTVQEVYAFSRIHDAFADHANCTLMGIAVRILRVRRDIERIAPGAKSRYFNHWEQVVIPVIEWCEDYVSRKRH